MLPRRRRGCATSDVRASATSTTNPLLVAFADGVRVAQAASFGAPRFSRHPPDGGARAPRHRTGADRNVRRVRLHAARAADDRVLRGATHPGATHSVTEHRLHSRRTYYRTLER